MRAQKAAQQVTDDGIVVDDEDARVHAAILKQRSRR
jgi:hypothetical protein